jgi:hypothetical protein
MRENIDKINEIIGEMRRCATSYLRPNEADTAVTIMQFADRIEANLRAAPAAEGAAPQASAGEAVAWTMVGPDGKTSIGAWHDMTSYPWSVEHATLREGHRYALAYYPAPAAAPAPVDVATLPIEIHGRRFAVPIRVHLHIVNLTDQLSRNVAGQPFIRNLLGHTEHCLMAADEAEDYETAPSEYVCTVEQQARVEREAQWCDAHTSFFSSYCYGSAFIRVCKKRAAALAALEAP